MIDDSADALAQLSRFSDVVIGLAYFAIPCQIFYFQRLLSKNFPFTWVVWLFEAFITWCGITHFIHIFPYFPPWTLALAKLITAVVSVITSLLLVRLMPKALSIPVKLVVLEEELGMRIQNEHNLIAQNDALQKLRHVTQSIRKTLNFRSICEISCSLLTNTFNNIDGSFIYFSASDLDTSRTTGGSACTFDCIAEKTLWTPLYSLSNNTSNPILENTFTKSRILWDENVRVMSKMFTVPIYCSNNAGSDHVSIHSDTRLINMEPLSSTLSAVTLLNSVDLACLLGVGHFQSALAVPLIVGNRTGFILVCSKQSDLFQVEFTELPLLCDLINQVQIALDQAHQIEVENMRLKQIGEQARINILLAKQKEEAQATTKMKTEFLATISHELRTPLNAIIGFVDLVLTQQGLTKDNREVLEMVASSSITLLTLVNNILDLSKLEFHGSKMQLENLPFSIRQCVEHAVDILHPTTESKGIRLNYFIDDAIPELVMGDSTRLQQILANLLSNAVKFTEKGEVYICASLTELPKQASCQYYQSMSSCVSKQKYLNFETPPASSQGNISVHSRLSMDKRHTLLSSSDLDWRMVSTSAPELASDTYDEHESLNSDSNDPEAITIYFQVVDTGVGISNENLHLLFEKFRQVDSRFSRRYQGTGLGLAITAKLVELYRGKIWVQSKYNEGSVFSFTLNLVPASDPTSIPIQQQRQQISIPNTSKDSINSVESLPSIVRSMTTPLGTIMQNPNDPLALLVLFVEESFTSRASTSLLLSSCGYSSIAFSTIVAATEHLATCDDDIPNRTFISTTASGQLHNRKPAAILVDEQTLSNHIHMSASEANLDALEKRAGMPSLSLAINAIQTLLHSCDIPIATILRPLRIRMPAPNSAISTGSVGVRRYSSGGDSQGVLPRTLPAPFYNNTLGKPLKKRTMSEVLARIIKAPPATSIQLSTSLGATPFQNIALTKYKLTSSVSRRTRTISDTDNNRLMTTSPVRRPKFVQSRSNTASPTPLSQHEFSMYFAQRFDGSNSLRSISEQTGRSDSLSNCVTATSSLNTVAGSDSAIGVSVLGDAESRLSGLEILVVDDNPINCSVAVKMLNFIGVKSVHTACDGLAGFKALEKRRYPFVFMDMSMPVMDGLEATAKIHRELAHPQPYICAMTASSLAEERDMCLQAGMNDFVSKPIKRQQLLEVFDRFFHSRLVQQRAQQQEQ